METLFGGISLESTFFITHNTIKGYDPFVCMASCNGISGHAMVDAHRSAFNYLIGNEGAVYQADLTVAYLSFYNHIFHKNASIEQAVNAMKIASGDTKFYYAIGQQLKNQRFAETLHNLSFPQTPGIQT